MGHEKHSKNMRRSGGLRGQAGPAGLEFSVLLRVTLDY